MKIIYLFIIFCAGTWNSLEAMQFEKRIEQLKKEIDEEKSKLVESQDRIVKQQQLLDKMAELNKLPCPTPEQESVGGGHILQIFGFSAVAAAILIGIGWFYLHDSKSVPASN